MKRLRLRDVTSLIFEDLSYGFQPNSKVNTVILLPSHVPPYLNPAISHCLRAASSNFDSMLRVPRPSRCSPTSMMLIVLSIISSSFLCSLVAKLLGLPRQDHDVPSHWWQISSMALIPPCFSILNMTTTSVGCRLLGETSIENVFD